MKYIYILLFFIFFQGFSQTYSGTPITLTNQFNGNYDFTAIGNTLNTVDNYTTPPPPCTINNSSSATLSLSATQTIEAAYLYWSGSGPATGNETVQLNGNSVTSGYTSLASFSTFNPSIVQIFGCRAEVTTLVQTIGNATYTVSNLNLTSAINPSGNNGSVYCTSGINYGGWALLIIYEEPTLLSRQVNIYEGFRVIAANFVNSINFNLNNLDVTSTTNAKIGLLAWNGNTFQNYQESIKFNGNTLSDLPLNPANNPFNSTSSYTGSSTLWNMDLDVFDVSSYLSIGDTSASIQVNSYNNNVALQHVVTAIPSELPDATVEIVSADPPGPCVGGSLDVEIEVFNTNATDILPSGTPVSFFLEDTSGNPVYVTTINTTQDIPIGGSEILTVTISVPPGTASPGVLSAEVNLDAAGNLPVAENNNENNSASFDIVLPETPPTPQLDNIEECGTPGETEIDLSEATTNVDTSLYDLSFFQTQTAADNGQPQVSPSNTYVPDSQNETLFVRVENANGCFSTGSFQVEFLPLPQTQVPTPLVSCTENSTNDSADFALSLKDAEINTGSGNLVSYFPDQATAENGDPADQLPDPYTAQPSQTVYARVEGSNGCFAIVELQLEVGQSPNLPVESFNSYACGESAPGEGKFDLVADAANSLNTNETNFQYSYYTSQGEAESGSNPINEPENYTGSEGELVYVRVENAEGCFSIAEIFLSIGTIPQVNPNVDDIVECDNDDQAVDLTLKNEEISPQTGNDLIFKYYLSQNAYDTNNPIVDPQNFQPATFPVTVFAAVIDENTGCRSETVSFSINFAELPEFGFGDVVDRVICVDPKTGEPLEAEAPIILDSGLSQGDYDFSWQRNGAILSEEIGSILEVSQAGEYQLMITTLTEPSCSKNATIGIIESSSPLFEVSSRETGTVVVSNIIGSGDYEFSVNGGPFRQAVGSSLLFEGVRGGNATFLGRDRNGCGQSEKEIFVLTIPNFFTPNNDGKNDNWGIPGLRNKKGVEIYIFDRFGKLLVSLPSRGSGWDGTYNGKAMPSNDYWFLVNYLDDNGNQKEIKGNLTLIR